jgi:hypothetical protein
MTEPQTLPPDPPPCPQCGATVPPELRAQMPLGRWDYQTTADGAVILGLTMPLDPNIIPFLKGVPVVHRCLPSPEQRADGSTLVAEAETFLRHVAAGGGK